MDLIPLNLDLAQLATRAGVSIRTVRYYIQQGLLPSPEARGPGAHYTEEHLERLQLIKRLQRDHLPLAEIRRVLENWSTEGKKWGMPASPATAKDYIRSVLGQSSEPSKMKIAVGRRDTPAPPAYPPVSDPTAIVYEDALPQSEKPSKSFTRSQWERLTLAPDIELHVRRPLSRELNRKLERVLETAREILKEEE